MSGIAERAGVGISSIYDYFRGKDGILDALVGELAEANLQGLQKELDATHGESLEATIERMADRIIAQMFERARLAARVAELTFRFGHSRRIVYARDSFAVSLAKRVRIELHAVTEEEAAGAMRWVSDALTGVALAELLRGAESGESIRPFIVRITRAEVGRLRTLHESRQKRAQRE